MSEPPHPATSTVLVGRYRLETLLGRGGMAEVWRATDTALGRQVAVKLLKANLAHDPVVGERFRREAIAAARLSHPNVVAVHDTIDDGGRQAVVMQYVKGRSLRQVLDEQHRLSPEHTALIGLSVAAALDAAHRAGMVHRDVKPGNILLTPDGRVLLTDFGIAKAIGGGDHDLTSDNVMMGTAKYLSPEQVRGRPLDGRSDLYALGLVLYECLAGQVPFLGDSDAETALARLQRDPTDLHRLRPTMPAPLVEVIHALLQVEPDQRPANGALVQRRLEPVADPLLALTGRPVPRDPTPGTGNPTMTASGSTSPPRPRTPPEPDRATPNENRGEPGGSAPGGSRTTERRDRPTSRPRTLIPLAVVIVIGGLAGLIWWIAGGTDSSEVSPPILTAVTDTVAAPPQGARDVTVQGVRVFDPSDHSAQVPTRPEAVLDGDPTTAWASACDDSRYLGGRPGIGLILDVDRPPYGTLALDMATAPWQVQVFQGDEPFDELEDWGAPVGNDFSTTPRTTEVNLDGSGRFVMVWLRELGRSDECGADAPFQGRISEIRLDAIG